MAREHFVGEIRDGIAWATFNRPESYNAWNDDIRNGMLELLQACEGSPEVRCLVLRGAGSHFMAGGDVKSFGSRLDGDASARAAGFSQSVRELNPIIEKLRDCSFPTLASVRGACAGLGFSFMLNCDMVVASDNAYFAFAYTNIGATPDGGASYYLPRLLGTRRAMQIAMLGDRIPAVEAERFGLVNWIVPQAELDERTEALARKLADGAAGAMSRTKALLYDSLDAELSTMLEREARAFGECAKGAELKEGVQAFLEKRSPRF